MVHRVKGLNVDIEAITMVGKPSAEQPTEQVEELKEVEKPEEEKDIMDDYEETMDEFMNSMGGQKEKLEKDLEKTNV